MTIDCENETQFYDAIYALVKMGVGFKARPDQLAIYLSGEF